MPGAYDGGSNHRRAANTLCAPMPPPRTLSWALESKPYGDIVLQKELNKTMELISKTTLETPGPKNMTLSGCITFLVVHQPLKRSNDVWTVKDYSDSDEWWDVQTLGYPFSKSHLVIQHQRANWDGPAQSKLLHTVEVDKVPVIAVKNMLGKTWAGLFLPQAKANPSMELLLLKNLDALGG